MEVPDRPLGEVFDQVADAYDEVRQGYSTEIVEEATRRGGLAVGARVLEAGCGTGKLTETLLALGLRVDAVDPGPRMIEKARQRVASSDSVSFHVGRFEDVPLPNRAYDAVFSATAFHWLDARASWNKAAMHLKPGGLLALLTHTSLRDDKSAQTDDAFRALLRKHAPAVAKEWPPQRDLEALLSGATSRSGNASEVWDWVMGDGRHRLANEEAGRLFEDVHVAVRVSHVERTADEVLSHFRTTSLYFQIPPEKRQAFEDEDRGRIEADGGTVHFASATVLMTARRPGAVPGQDAP